MIKEQVLYVCQQFNIDGNMTDFAVFTDGHINSTYCVTFEKDGEIKKYLVQTVNTVVFKNPDELMQNIVSVTKYLRKKIAENGGDPERETLKFLKCNDGNYFAYFFDKCWRIYKYVDNSFTCNKIENPEVFENAGRSFGLFQRNLDGYPIDTLFETIKDFHNTPKRLRALVESFEADAVGRAKEVEEDFAFALKRLKDTQILLDCHERGEIPLRVTHNDTKLNNILFDRDTKKSICVIDLDTIMPGFSLYDFGDALRFGANTTREDDDNLDNVSFSLELFESFTKGFLSACAKELTETEIKYLAFSAKLMTYECGIRFLKDYIDGDVYFRINPDIPKQNLIRARNQFRLVEDIERKLDEMNAIVAKLYKQYV